MIDGAKHTTMDTVKSTPLFLPLSSTLIFIGPATFCYTIHYCVLAIGAEELENMKNENTPYSPTSGENTPEVTGESEHDKILIDREIIHFDDNIESNNPIYVVQNALLEKSKDVEYNTIVTKEKFNIENFTNKVQNTSPVNEKYEFKTVGEKEEKDVVKVTAVSDITGPLGSAYIMTSLLNIFMGGAGYAFYRASVMIRCDNHQSYIYDLKQFYRFNSYKIPLLFLCRSISFLPVHFAVLLIFHFFLPPLNIFHANSLKLS